MNNLQKGLPNPLPKGDDEDRWVDVHNHELMVYLGIHKPYYVGRDPKVWTKTDAERKQLAQLKARCTTILPSGWPGDKPRSKFSFDLIVRVRPSNKYKFVDKHGNTQKKTYFSHKNVCLTDIPNILAKYYVWKKDEGRQSLVISYTWNGKTYSPNELPNVRWK
jgi:hypothetical protein